jgi:hypothetical protein
MVILYGLGSSLAWAQSSTSSDASTSDLTPPVHYWKFDEVSDSHSSPDQGTGSHPVPAALTGATLGPGKYGQAVEFAATTNPAPADGDPATPAKGNFGAIVNIPIDLSGLIVKGLTVSLWFRGELPPKTYSSLFNDGRNKGLEIRINTTSDIIVNTSTTWNLLKALKAVPKDPNKWTHVAVVCADNKVMLYVNGALVDSKDNVQPPFFTDRITLGGAFEKAPDHPNDSEKFTYGLVGALDDLRIYDYALSADQIMALSKAAQPPDANLSNP